MLTATCCHANMQSTFAILQPPDQRAQKHTLSGSLTECLSQPDKGEQTQKHENGLSGAADTKIEEGMLDYDKASNQDNKPCGGSPRDADQPSSSGLDSATEDKAQGQGQGQTRSQSPEAAGQRNNRRARPGVKGSGCRSVCQTRQGTPPIEDSCQKVQSLRPHSTSAGL